MWMLCSCLNTYFIFIIIFLYYNLKINVLFSWLGYINLWWLCIIVWHNKKQLHHPVRLLKCSVCSRIRPNWHIHLRAVIQSIPYNLLLCHPLTYLCLLFSSATHKLLSTAPRRPKPHSSCDTGSHASSNSGTDRPGDTRHWEAVCLSRWLPFPVWAWGDGHCSSVLISQSDQTAGSEACCTTVWHAADVLSVGTTLTFNLRLKASHVWVWKQLTISTWFHIKYIIACALSGWCRLYMIWFLFPHGPFKLMWAFIAHIGNITYNITHVTTLKETCYHYLCMAASSVFLSGMSPKVCWQVTGSECYSFLYFSVALCRYTAVIVINETTISQSIFNGYSESFNHTTWYWSPDGIHPVFMEL